MKKTPTISILVLFFATSACGETEECKKLRELKSQYERAVGGVTARVRLKAQTEKKLAAMEAKVKEAKEKVGLDLSETKLAEELAARASKIPGTTIERTTRQVSDLDESGSGAGETLWRIRYPAKDAAEGFDRMRLLAAEPPLFQLVTLLDEGKGKWLLELMRASVVEVPTTIKPIELPAARSAADIEEELGFCGAGDLRDDIAELDKAWLAAKGEAEQLSVVLPKIATNEGLERRVSQLAEVERENRKLIDALAAAAAQEKVAFKGVGVERVVVIYEFHGGQKERTRLEKRLPEEIQNGMKELDSTTKNVMRLSVVNRVADQQIKRSSSFKPGVGLAPERK